MQNEQLIQLLDVDEVAELFHASPYTIRSWIRKGILRATKLGRLVRVEPKDVQDFIEKGRQQ